MLGCSLRRKHSRPNGFISVGGRKSPRSDGECRTATLSLMLSYIRFKTLHKSAEVRPVPKRV